MAMHTIAADAEGTLTREEYYREHERAERLRRLEAELRDFSRPLSPYPPEDRVSSIFARLREELGA